jgi:hypothetical protein
MQQKIMMVLDNNSSIIVISVCGPRYGSFSTICRNSLIIIIIELYTSVKKIEKLIDFYF